MNDDTQDLPQNQLFYNWEDFAANKEHLSQHKWQALQKHPFYKQ